MNNIMTGRAHPAAERVILLEPGGSQQNYWRDMWHYRELFAILAWRDASVRFKQTAIGVTWAVLRPFLTMLVFTFVFSRIANLPSVGDAPYPIMVFAGMLPWFLFATILSEGANSLVSNASLIGKIYFPRIIVPIATGGVAVIDFLISLLLLFLMMVWFGYIPSWHIVLLPIFILYAVIASLGPTLYIAALNVKYRDFRYVIPFIVQFGMYLSPVGFSSAIVPEQWRFWYSLNPIVSVIDGFRWCLLGGDSAIYLPGLIASLIINLGFLWLGFTYFRKTERTFADLI